MTAQDSGGAERGGAVAAAPTTTAAICGRIRAITDYVYLYRIAQLLTILWSYLG